MCIGDFNRTGNTPASLRDVSIRKVSRKNEKPPVEAAD